MALAFAPPLSTSKRAPRGSEVKRRRLPSVMAMLWNLARSGADTRKVAPFQYQLGASLASR
jgi:hypothetical protein